uniref:Uncharacterized protein n=1 Tax=Chromera velia CCMP2878 TaxID=1169474 RepID=A0A0G4IE61_9ALVE|eukprot:Cvel_13639.t1-p1 / transcript=Cvel_13639.t1 / gene=Cvel_13639 / organism=Chromera_velia_CCMP2878 / gene_product=hypothetical protein / transcript_product=hypothetical protein / location=Cvel_scaffold940:28068-28283(+) / protein_length=72 / sequence_SO=supercontig / SO=protein_coding / is_pseudo=false
MSFKQFQAEVGATLLQVQQSLTAVQQTQQQQGQILTELQQRQMEQAAAAVQQPMDVQGDGMLFGGGQGGLPL